MAERDLKLGHFVAIRLIKPLTLLTDGLVGVAAAYVDNVARVKALAIFPIISMVSANVKERIAGAALMSVKGPLHGEGSLTREQKREYEALQVAMHQAFAKDRTDVQRNREMISAIRHIQSNVKHDQIAAGIEAWLAAQITDAWTAFETMSGDLWEAALNCHPTGLAELKGTHKGGGGSEEGKSVPLELLQKYQYDLSKSMGSVLKEKRSFDRLGNIKRYYAEAFGDRADKINEILSDRSIETLSVVRNLIVHRASVVDDEYLRRIKNLPGAPKAEKGKKIMLDEEIVAKLVQPVMQLGADLIVAIDAWIAAN